MSTELQSLSSPYSKKNNAEMWHFKNANNSGIFNWTLSYCPPKLCAPYSTMHFTTQPLRCGVWKEVAEPTSGLLPAPTFSLVRTFLSWLQSSGFFPWCSWDKEKHSFMWWGHEIYNLGNQGHKTLLKSLIKACKEGRRWDCGFWVRSEF